MVRVLVATIAAAVTCVAPAIAQTAAASSALPHIGIGNFGRVSETYYRGEQPKGADYRALAALGITTVIDLQRDFEADEQRLVEAAGMRFFRIPLTVSSPPTAAEVARFLDLVNDPANQPVYVHCRGGRHRTGVMTAAYRMTHDGWTAAQAYAEMKKYRFKVALNFLFGHAALKEFVFDFYEHLTETQTPPPDGQHAWNAAGPGR
jgi:tyrosine-protein phosphatase SIW14